MVAWPLVAPSSPRMILASTEAITLPVGAVSARRASLNSSSSTGSAGPPAEAPVRGKPAIAISPWSNEALSRRASTRTRPSRPCSRLRAVQSISTAEADGPSVPPRCMAPSAIPWNPIERTSKPCGATPAWSSTRRTRPPASWRPRSAAAVAARARIRQARSTARNTSRPRRRPFESGAADRLCITKTVSKRAIKGEPSRSCRKGLVSAGLVHGRRDQAGRRTLKCHVLPIDSAVGMMCGFQDGSVSDVAEPRMRQGHVPYRAGVGELRGFP